MNANAIEISEERIDCVDLRINEHARVENPREYSPELVKELGSLLRQGAEGHLDPQRVNFYELDGGRGTFYIYISPVTANVMLLAWWAHESVSSLATPISEKA
jgi:hypothetical protein